MIYRKRDISIAALYHVSEETAKELIDYRFDNKEKKRQVFSQRSFERALKEAFKCSKLGITPDEAIELSIDKTWVSVTYDFVKKALEGREGNGTSQGYRQQNQTRSSRADDQYREIINGSRREH